MSKIYFVVNTDSFDGDYPNEKFLCRGELPEAFGKEHAEQVADVLNGKRIEGYTPPRWWKVVENGYKLQPGFEP